MIKIITALIVASSFLTIQSANAAKIGAGFDQGFGIAGQFSNINAFIGNDGISADYLLKQGAFGKDIPFNWYVGAGAYIDWSGHDELGLRVPLGVTLPFASKWDVYGQFSPNLGYDFDDDDLEFGLSGALGVRYSF